MIRIVIPINLQSPYLESLIWGFKMLGMLLEWVNGDKISCSSMNDLDFLSFELWLIGLFPASIIFSLCFYHIDYKIYCVSVCIVTLLFMIRSSNCNHIIYLFILLRHAYCWQMLPNAPVSFIISYYPL
jgi:hypothetical protein